MYEAFFHLARRPFVGTPDPNCWFPTELVQHAHDAILLGLRERSGVAILSGAAGVGKTLLCERFARELGNDHPVVFLRHPRFATRRSLLQTILGELELPFSRLSEQELRQEFERFLNQMVEQGHQFFLICDEAHLLEDKIIEELRAFSDLHFHGQSVVRLLLAGQLELEERLATPELQSLAQRVTTHSALETLNRAESHEFLDYRLTWAGGRLEECFTPDALSLIAEVSGGSPRCLCLLADHSLLLAFALGEKPVSVSIVENALNDLKHLALPWQLKMVRSTELSQSGLADEPASLQEATDSIIDKALTDAVNSPAVIENDTESASHLLADSSAINPLQPVETGTISESQALDDWDQLELSSIEIGAGVETENHPVAVLSQDDLSAIEEEFAEESSRLAQSSTTGLPGKFDDWSVMSSEPELKGQHFAAQVVERQETSIQQQTFDDIAMDDFGQEDVASHEIESHFEDPHARSDEHALSDALPAFAGHHEDSDAATHDSAVPVSEQEALELRLERMLAKWRLATDQDQIKGPHTPFSSQWQLLDQVDTPESPQNSTGPASTSLSSNHGDIDAIGLSHDEDPALYVAEDHLKSTSSSNATSDLKRADHLDAEFIETEVPSSLFVHPSWGVSQIPQDFVPFSDPTKLFEAIENHERPIEVAMTNDVIPVIPLPEAELAVTNAASEPAGPVETTPADRMIDSEQSGIAATIDQILPWIDVAAGRHSELVAEQAQELDRKYAEINSTAEHRSEMSPADRQAARLAKYVAGDLDEIRERALAAEAMDLAEGTRAALNVLSQGSNSGSSQLPQQDQIPEEAPEPWEADLRGAETESEDWLNPVDESLLSEDALSRDEYDPVLDADDKIMNGMNEIQQQAFHPAQDAERIFSKMDGHTEQEAGESIDTLELQPTLATRYRNLFSILRRRATGHRR